MKPGACQALFSLEGIRSSIQAAPVHINPWTFIEGLEHFTLRPGYFYHAEISCRHSEKGFCGGLDNKIHSLFEDTI